MTEWINIKDRHPKEGQKVIYSLDKVTEVVGLFHYFEIGPLPPIPCFSNEIGWLAAEWWREKEETQCI